MQTFLTAFTNYGIFGKINMGNYVNKLLFIYSREKF